MKNIKRILIIYLFVLNNVFSNPIDTIQIKGIIEKTDVFKKRNYNSSIFKITSFKRINEDSSKITIRVLYNDFWNKKNNPFDDFFTGYLIKNEKFIFHGNFTFSLLNYNNVSVSTSGTYIKKQSRGTG